SGVRISWLMVARNSPLASTAASAACLACTSCCSSWSWRRTSRCNWLRSYSAVAARARVASSARFCARAAAIAANAATSAQPARITTSRLHGPSNPARAAPSAARMATAASAARPAQRLRDPCATLEHRVLEIEVQVAADRADQVALDEVDAGHPHRRGGLRVLDLLADHLQVLAVGHLDHRAQLVAQGVVLGRGGEAPGHAHVAQRHLREQRVGFIARL